MDAARFLNSLVNYETNPGYDYDLNAFRSFLDLLGAPDTKLRNIIQIGGTKGKGSVTALLESILQASGYRVGSFTSPHLNTVHERIKISGKRIREAELQTYLDMCKPFIGTSKRARTYFEVLTAVAFLHFLKQRTDFAILEVGLGGRLDSTNVITPLLSVITRIGYDHQNLLGGTLPLIAREKAGIIKQGVPLITIHQRPSVLKIVKNAARKAEVLPIYADASCDINVLDIHLKGMDLHVFWDNETFRVHTPLIGRHHIENVQLALTAIVQLRSAGFTIPTEAVKKGMENISLKGRFQVIATNPLMIFDCAHNEDSFRALDATLHEIGLEEFILIFGISENKDFRYCLKTIMPRARQILLVQAEHPRAVIPAQLLGLIRRYNTNVIVAGTVRNALQYASQNTMASQGVVITGSFYLWQPEWSRCNG